MPSVTVQQALAAATQLQRAGRLADAENVYRQLLAQEPDCADALHLLGVLHAQRGQNQQAVELIGRAIALFPGSALYHSNLARIQYAAKNVDDAIAGYRHAASLQPGNAQAQDALGTALFGVQRLDEAIGAYRRAVEIQPDFADGWSNLANALRNKGDLSEALSCCRKALAIRADFVEAVGVLANVLRDLGQIDQAIAEYQRAIVLRGDMPELYNNLALALHDRGRFDQAIAALDKAVALRPDYTRAWSNRSKVLRDNGWLDGAAAAARRALAISPEHAEAHQNLGTVLLDSGQVAQAIESGRRALELSPGMSEAHNLVGNALKEDGSVAEAVESFDRALLLKPGDARVHSNKVYTMQFHPGCDARDLFNEQRRWDQLHAEPLKHLAISHERDGSVDRKLRVGYVSPYFYAHAESFFVVPLLESHDHGQFEVHCYSDVLRPDAVTERLRGSADVWHDCRGRTDAELAEQIRGDRIDILIDLTMHMAHNRALAFARKPAPVQVAWLAYPGGTGLDAMDFRITDSWIDPIGQDDSCYREQSIRLPNCWCCYDPLSDVPAAPARGDGPIRFGSLNNPCKLNDTLLRLWARVMQAVPDSQLLLQVLTANHRQRILDLYQSLNIAPDRLEFVARCSRPEYLRLYDRIDICLDPLPYNGITTTCDAMWMGVPVVTLAGQTAAGRAGMSILMNVGLGELTARDAEQFLKVAATLAGDLPRLAGLRSSLRERMRKSPLMDGRRFARDMELTYHGMWRQWREGSGKT
jgi:protein O-GlcNAc transferase